MSGPPAVLPPSEMHDSGRPAGLWGALEDRLRRVPEEPVLFYPDGLDVRWRSWRSLVEQAVGGAEALSVAGVEAGARVAFRWRCHPDAVAADLAVQGAGGVAVPVAEPAAAVGCAARLVLPGDGGEAWGSLGDLPAVALPEARAPWERRAAAPAVPVRAGGGARVTEPGVGGSTREVSATEIVEAARELGVRIEHAAAEADAVAGGGRRTAREIALVHLDLRSADGRALLSWGLLSGSALFLEPDPRSVPASSAWARPTLVAAGAAPLVELARQLRRREEGRLRKLLRQSRPPHPFGRLRLLLVLGGGRLPVDDVTFWAERGVVILRG